MSRSDTLRASGPMTWQQDGKGDTSFVAALIVYAWLGLKQKKSQVSVRKKFSELSSAR